MYSRISIRNLRGIESLDASGFRRINLIVGRNNAGKTTFLEGLILLGGAADPLLPGTLAALRGVRSEGRNLDAAWRPLFHDLAPGIPIEIRAQWSDAPQMEELKIEGRRSMANGGRLQPAPSRGTNGVISVSQDDTLGGLILHFRDGLGHAMQASASLDPTSGNVTLNAAPTRSYVVRTTLLSSRSMSTTDRDAQQFSSIRRAKQDSEVVDALRIIEPNVQAIEVLSEAGGPAIYLDIGLRTLVPLAVCGEGMVRLFSIILELIASRDGVLLVDEIDNGLHYSVMPRLWEVLRDLVERHNVQVFATTHNEDIIRSALEAFAGKDGMLGLFRIDRRGGQHAIAGYDEEAMKGVLEEHFEVRG